MSEQAPGPLDHQGPGPAQGVGADPYKIHGHAMKASAELEAIATALGHAQAPPKVTASFTKMAEVCRSLAGNMAAAPSPPEKAAPAGPGTMDSATSDLAQAARR